MKAQKGKYMCVWSVIHLQAIDVYRQLCIQLYMYAYARFMCIQNRTHKMYLHIIN